MDIKNLKTLSNPEAVADFLRLPLSISLATSKDPERPSCARCLGCRFDASSLELCLYVSETASKKLLDDVETHPKLAAVFCLPSTEQTIQIKCTVGRIRSIGAEERQFIAAARQAFAAEVANLGFDAAFTEHYLCAENCVAIVAEASEFYDQTPGPLAGSILKVKS